MKAFFKGIWIFSFLALCVIIFYSYDPEDVDKNEHTLNETVYIAGWETNKNGILIAKYWKNGNHVCLSDGTNEAYANEIYAQ